MSKLMAVLLFIVGVINFLPVLGVVSGARISSAYGIDVASSDLEILMRHRALLFGILGGFILYSVFVPTYRDAAMVMAGVSMVGYLFFLWVVGDYNAMLSRVMLVDIIGIICLIGAVICRGVLPGPAQ